MLAEAPLWIGAVTGAALGGLAAWGWLRGRARVQLERLEELERELVSNRRQLERLGGRAAGVADGGARRVEAVSREGRRIAAELAAADRALLALVESRPGEAPSDAGALATAVREASAALAEARRLLEQRVSELGAGLTASPGDGGGAEPAGSPSRAAAEVAAAAGRAADAARALDEGMRKIQDSAADTAELSTQVAAEAERGYKAVHLTLDEIERIRTLSDAACERIEALGARVAGIGHIVRVIQDIAEKTNLLALNASIIAAQAGQHGRSFAVVAREIKALAQQTEASTKEIAAQIEGVQAESTRATEAMESGVVAVNEGFQVALDAGDALDAIRRSSRTAQKRVQSMTRTVTRQAVSERVVEAAREVAERAAALAGAAPSGDGARAARAALAHLERMAGAVIEAAGGVGDAADGLDRVSGQAMAAAAAGAERSAELIRLLDRVRDQLATRAAAQALEGPWAELDELAGELRARVAELSSP